MSVKYREPTGLPPGALTMPRPSPFDRALDNIVKSSHQSRRILASPSEDAARPVGSTRPCPDCGATIEWRELTGPTGRTVRYWSDCPCWQQRIARLDALSAASSDRQAELRGVVPSAASRIGDYARFTLETFNPARLPDGFALVANAREWLEHAPLAQSVCESTYTTPATCALYFYSPGRGRGKTHLAAGVANAARAANHLVAIVDERSFVDEYWATKFEERPKLTQLSSLQSRLTVYDDIGARQNTTPGLREVWDLLISPRWTRMGWSIFTSNYTPDELLNRGTIDDRVYSRLMQMTQGRVITFGGRDQRLPS